MRVVDRGAGIPECGPRTHLRAVQPGTGISRAQRQRPRTGDRQGLRRGERRARLGGVAAGAGRVVRPGAPARSRCPSRPGRERNARPRRRRRAADPPRAPDDAPRSRLRGGHGDDRCGGVDEGGRPAARGDHPRPRPPGSQRSRGLPRAARLVEGADPHPLGRRRGGREGGRPRRRSGRLRDEALRPRRAARAPACGAPPGAAHRGADDRGGRPAHRPREARRHSARRAASA